MRKLLLIFIILSLAGCGIHRTMYLHIVGDKIVTPYGAGNGDVTYNAETEVVFGCKR